MKVSKNISRGEQIKDLSELYSLACKKRSVVFQRGTFHWVRPAAFLLFWPLAELLKGKVYYAVKEDEQ